MEIILRSKGYYRVTLGLELEPNNVAERTKHYNKLDEAYGLLCLSISKDLHFHLSGLKTPKAIWEQLETLFGKQDELRDFQLENELISLSPKNFETINEFFTRFKHLAM